MNISARSDTSLPTPMDQLELNVSIDSFRQELVDVRAEAKKATSSCATLQKRFDDYVAAESAIREENSRTTFVHIAGLVNATTALSHAFQGFREMIEGHLRAQPDSKELEASQAKIREECLATAEHCASQEIETFVSEVRRLLLNYKERIECLQQGQEQLRKDLEAEQSATLAGKRQLRKVSSFHVCRENTHVLRRVYFIRWMRYRAVARARREALAREFLIRMRWGLTGCYYHRWKVWAANHVHETAVRKTAMGAIRRMRLSDDHLLRLRYFHRWKLFPTKCRKYRVAHRAVELMMRSSARATRSCCLRKWSKFVSLRQRRVRTERFITAMQGSDGLMREYLRKWVALVQKNHGGPQHRLLEKDARGRIDNMREEVANLAAIHGTDIAIVHHEISAIKSDLSEVRATQSRDFYSFQARLQADFDALGTSVRADISTLGSTFKCEIGALELRVSRIEDCVDQNGDAPEADEVTSPPRAVIPPHPNANLQDVLLCLRDWVEEVEKRIAAAQGYN